MVINNGVCLCWGISLATGIRTITLPITYPQLYGVTATLHFENTTTQFISLAQHNISTFIIYPNSSCINLNTYVTWITCGA